MASGLFNFFKPKAAKQSQATLPADDVAGLFQAADAAAKAGESDRALQVFEKVLELQPDHAPAHYKRGNLLKDRQRLEDALESYDRAVTLDPGYAHAFCNRGFVLERLERWDAALESYDRAISITPGDALAHYNRAGVLRELGRPQDALAGYTEAIAIRPDYFEAYCNRGGLLTEMKQYDEALQSHAKSLEINPNFAPAHNGRGVAYQKKRAWSEALQSYDRAIAIDPASAITHRNRGRLLVELRDWQGARASLERAIALKPDYPEAYVSMALALGGLRAFDGALANFDRALALKPDYAEAHFLRGSLLIEMKRFIPAIESYDRGLALEQEVRFVLGMRQYAKMNAADWSDFSADMQRLVAGIETGEAVSPPMPVLALVDSVALQQKAAQIWVKETIPEQAALPAIPPRPRPDRARIGYFSADFHDHPVSILMAKVIETHDRSKYEAIAFSLGSPSQDDMRKRLEKGFDQFIDVHGKSDSDIARLARAMEIDIAIDLVGHTGNGRPGIFELRAAPLQVNYLGYPGTTGAECMDYLIADATVIPERYERYYAEKILRLPHSYLPNDSTRTIASTIYSRADLGLPATGFVFCCFNNGYKITPDVFDSWMRILTRVPGSVLWLSQNNEPAMDNLRREAVSRGVAGERLIFAQRMDSLAEHLARHRAADLFLDTRPYNAHATAMNALWAGLPVLTLPGEGFASRVAASLLHAVGLPELIATSAGDYEDMAVGLAENPQRHAAMKERLAHDRLNQPLFDTHRFVRHLEAGYAAILARHDAGLPPEHIRVPP